MRISDWSSDVCSSDLPHHEEAAHQERKGVEDEGGLSGDLRAGRRAGERNGREGEAPEAQLAAERYAHDFHFLGSSLTRSEERRDGDEWVSTGGCRWRT